MPNSNLVLNGSFETGDFTDWSVTDPDPNPSLADIGVDTYSGDVDQGTYGVYAGNSYTTTLSQTISTTIGHTYTVSFYLDVYQADATDGFMTASFGGQSVTDLSEPSETDQFTLYSANIVATTSSSLLQFQFLDPGGYFGFDNVGVTDNSLCYLRGTRILTPTGEVPIEKLRIGDAIVTRFGGIRPVKWIGRQTYDSRFLRANPGESPVRIRAGALARNVPARDLFVSPGHSVLVGDTLVLARCLVNGVSVTQDWAPPIVDYFQIELETHDCLIAEGSFCETFADGPGLRNHFHNRPEFFSLYPDYREPAEIKLCAPRALDGAALAATLMPVVARAAQRMTPGPLRGYIDAPIGNDICCWAQDMDHPFLPVALEILLGNTVIGTSLACDYRADLEAAGIGRGRAGLRFASPVELTPALLNTLRIRRAGDHAEIATTGAYRDCLGTARGADTACLNEAA